MSFMPWTDAMVLGIDSIDDQHHWLVDAINTLYDELNGPGGPCRDVIGHILESLMDYTMNHFLLEEELFQRFGYPETVAHKTEHDGFTHKAMGLLTRFEGGDSVNAEVLDFLKDWLTQHILKVDRAYIPFLKAQGVV